MPLSDTARSILTEASQHPLGIAASPGTLPAVARHAVLRSLVRQELVAEYSAPADHPGLGWRQADGTTTAMQITKAGRQAISCGKAREAVDEPVTSGRAEAEQELMQHARDAGINSFVDDEIVLVAAAGIVPGNGPTMSHSESRLAPATSPVPVCDEDGKGVGGPSRSPRVASRQFHLREAAQVVLAAWGTQEQLGLAAAIDALQAALVSKRPVPEDAAPRTPRPDTKQAAVLALLRRPEGVSGPQLIEATGWAPHTVRGFLAGLGRKGIAVKVLERVCQVGANKAGAKGSYSIYRIAEAG